MKKEEILEKILPLAAERGLRSLSTADIAAAAGLKTGGPSSLIRSSFQGSR